MADLTRRLLDAGTSVIADVFDERGSLPQVLDNSLHAETKEARFAGPAYTITGRTEGWEDGGDRAKLKAIDEMPSDVVAVWAGNDMRGVCCFGDLLAEAMKARGCAGVVVDGGIRDVSALQRMRLPVVARYRTPAQAIGRWRVTDHQVEITVRGALQDHVTVRPNDVVVVDDDGAIVVPHDLVQPIARRVAEISSEESSARGDIRDGMPLLAALDRYGHL